MPFVTYETLAEQLDFTLDEQGQKQATRRLEMASNLARFYGLDSWTDLAVPAIVRDIVLNVVERYMRNPDGYTQSRAGDETVAWRDPGDEGNWYVSSSEKEILAGLGKPSFGIGTVSTVIWGTKANFDGRNPDNDIMLHTDPHLAGDLFPYFSGKDFPA